MKKTLLLLFAAFATLVTNAQTKVEINGIWYNLVSKAKQAEVTYKGSGEYSGSITIPATVTYEGVNYSVTRIGNWAFEEYSGLTTINIPESVTSIGDGAFYYCRGLTTINIPESVTSIGDNAFNYCSSLTAINIPEGVTSIGDYTFANCSRLTEITIPEGVTSIGFSAFSGCSSLTAINIPEGVTSIGGYTFSGCSGLTAITIPEGVTSIGNNAFEGCSGLTAITIPGGVTSIESSAFYGCSSLTTIVLPESVKYIRSEAFANCSELLDVYCYAETVPSTSADAFDGSYIEHATLHVPASAMNSYKTTAPWSEFGTIVELGASITRITLDSVSATLTEGNELTLTMTTTPSDADRNLISWSSSDPSVATVDNTGKVTAIAPGTATITATANDGSGVRAQCEVTVNELILGECATPTINYEDGKVILTCETEGAKVITNVVAENAHTYEDLEFTLSATYTLTAYATKEKYEDSDEVSLTLCWVPCEEHEEEDDESTGILTIPAKPVLISTQGGTITVSGLAADTEVIVTNTAGTPLATATATDGTATLTTGLEAGSIAIVKIGDYSIKVAIK